MCLTETRTDVFGDTKYLLCDIYKKNRQKPTNARSGRIITAVRDNIVKYEKINIHVTYNEYVFWFKLDKVLLNF